MKIICEKSDLLKSINTVTRAVPNKTTLKILECILVDALQGEIRLIANDMELGIETTVEGTIVDKGRIALDAKLFSDIVKKLPDQTVMITTNDRMQTEIVCESTKFNIPGKEGDDFPYLPFVEKKDSICVPQVALKDMVRQTIFSTSQNENNRMMMGELFEIDGNILKIVSLDGHRISIRKFALEESYEKKKLVVPARSLEKMMQILSGDEEDKAYLYYTKNHILFEMENTRVVSRLIEGEYFRIEQMLSSDYETKVVVDKRSFVDDIDRAMTIIKETEKSPVVIRIDDRDMELTVHTQNSSMDTAIPIEKEGKDIVIGFNPRFLMEALRVIDDDQVTLYLVNPKAPCFIRNVEETYIYLILPVNINV